MEITIGLYYNGARYLAAWLGRWTSADPIGIGADGPGLYNYTRGSPVNYTDPNGLETGSDHPEPEDLSDPNRLAGTAAYDVNSQPGVSLPNPEEVTAWTPDLYAWGAYKKAGEEMRDSNLAWYSRAWGGVKSVAWTASGLAALDAGIQGVVAAPQVAVGTAVKVGKHIGRAEMLEEGGSSEAGDAEQLEALQVGAETLVHTALAALTYEGIARSAFGGAPKTAPVTPTEAPKLGPFREGPPPSPPAPPAGGGGSGGLDGQTPSVRINLAEPKLKITVDLDAPTRQGRRFADAQDAFDQLDDIQHAFDAGKKGKLANIESISKSRNRALEAARKVEAKEPRSNFVEFWQSFVDLARRR